jgi:hypothetical protein
LGRDLMSPMHFANQARGPEFAYPDQGSGPSLKRRGSSCKKYLTGYVNYGMIVHNLKRKENYGLFSIKNTC